MNATLGAAIAGIGALAYCNTLVKISNTIHTIYSYSQAKEFPLVQRIAFIAAHLLHAVGNFFQAYSIVEFGAYLWEGISLSAAAHMALPAFLIAQACFIGARAIFELLATRRLCPC